jgi:aspartyl-tRNA(Asn)/glutamyl-tRNA(Gln) amidotransferase subunit A
VRDALAAVDKIDGDIRGFTSLFGERASEIAMLRDEHSSLALEHPLWGEPIAIKDNICMRGTSVSCGSRVLNGYLSSYDASVVERLNDNGVVIIGKTNMDEFAMGSTTTNSVFPVRY